MHSFKEIVKRKGRTLRWVHKGSARGLVRQKVGEGGARLSGGERQHLTCRAILKDVLCCSWWATASADPENEADLSSLAPASCKGKLCLKCASSLNNEESWTRFSSLKMDALVEQALMRSLFAQRSLPWLCWSSHVYWRLADLSNRHICIILGNKHRRISIRVTCFRDSMFCLRMHSPSWCLLI